MGTKVRSKNNRVRKFYFTLFFFLFFRFIEFMKNWTKNDKLNFMDIAYTAERSIEDELDRTSKAEVTTMIVSYAVMFIYIAVALGKFKKSSECFVSTIYIYSKLCLRKYLFIVDRIPLRFSFTVNLCSPCTGNEQIRTEYRRYHYSTCISRLFFGYLWLYRSTHNASYHRGNTYI